MRIGVVCEGPTDVHPISDYFAARLAHAGVEARFLHLQPDPDATNPSAGWGNIEYWLENNPPTERISRYLVGLFESGLDAKKCDAFLIQMDVDHVDHQSFIARMTNKYAITPSGVAKVDRVSFAKQSLAAWAQLASCTHAIAQKHVIVPAADSSETWCIAAFDKRVGDVEDVRGKAKVQLFMDALHISESRACAECVAIDKTPARRARFCAAYRRFHQRIYDQCEQFRLAADALAALA